MQFKDECDEIHTRLIGHRKPAPRAELNAALRTAATARRKAGPTATLRALLPGASHVFPQYHARTQIATMLSYCRDAEFECLATPAGLRVTRTL